MRFMGLVGIAILMTIAYLVSKNKKAINWRTVFWGLFLQLLFATMILGEATISFAAAILMLLIIGLYLTETRFTQLFPMTKKLPLPVLATILLIKLAIFGAIGYFIPSVISILIGQITLGLVVLVWLLRKNAKFCQTSICRMPLNSSLLLFYFALGLGSNIALAMSSNFTAGTIAINLASFSASVGDFLSIPTRAGASMIFGSLAAIQEPWYFLFFVQVLPTIIFFAAFISVLYYIGVVQVFVVEMSLFMRWSMKTSGAETLSCSGNIFVGQTEAPILIKPFIQDMTNSELHAVMTGGFATIAGGVFAGFVAMGISPQYLIGASIMSAPAALMLSKMFYPETEESKTSGDAPLPEIQTSDNIVGAAAQGTADGLQLALNVGAMLLAFIALIKVIDMGLGLISPDLTLNGIFGSIFQYLAIILGVPLQDAKAVGSLLGNKVAINEFVAYGNLSTLIQNGALSPRSIIIATYALCGFANFSSIGIQIGGIAPMAPERRPDLARIGFSAMWAGAFASWITAAIAGIFFIG